MTKRARIALAQSHPFVDDPGEVKELQIHGAIEHLDPADFTGFQNLEELTVAPDIEEIRGLTKAGGFRAGDRTIPRALFSGLPKLRRLSLLMKGLTWIQVGAFEGLGRLESLNLSDNRIAGIDRGALRDIPLLSHLSLERNSLRCIDTRTFCDLPGLMVLKLDSNQITTVEPEAFTSNRRLLALGLAGNPLHQVADSAFRGLSGLSSISLSRKMPIRALLACREHLGKNTQISVI